MLPRRVVFGRLVDFFMAQGFRPVDESLEEGYARLKSGREELVLRVVDDSSSRDELLSAVIQSAFDAASGKIAYLALPVEMISKIGDYAFRVHRIGVVVYDEHSVVELVGGGRREQTRAKEAEMDETRVEAMLNSLSARLSRLEEALERLRDLEELEHRVETLEKMYEELLRGGLVAKAEQRRDIEKGEEDKQREAEERRTRKPVPQKEELPHFLKDNPWVSILSEKQ